MKVRHPVLGRVRAALRLRWRAAASAVFAVRNPVRWVGSPGVGPYLAGPPQGDRQRGGLSALGRVRAYV